jgi:hypothetical protein
MPGSKRNKLKKMLSPSSTPSSAQDSISSVTSTLSPPPLDGAIPPPVVHADGIARDGDNYMTDEKLQEELAIVEEMQQREKTVGSGMDLGQRDAVVSQTASPGPSEGKKKTSRQRFEEREVSVRLCPDVHEATDNDHEPSVQSEHCLVLARISAAGTA